MIKDYIRKDLKDFTPYHAPVKDYDVKIDANENPYAHKEDVMGKVIEWLQDTEHIRRYPDTDCNDLRDAIAKYWAVEKDNVICGVGSDQLIDCLLKVFLEPGDHVLMPTPSFSMYQISTKLNRGIPVEFSLKEDYAYPIEEMIALYEKYKPKCVFLCTPNNPTGSTLSIEDIERLLEVMKCPVVIDEAYGEFVTDTMINKISQYENIIVLKTFSKAYGLAGLRVGYGIAQKHMIDAVGIVIPPYHLNSLSQFVAKTVLEYSKDYDGYVKSIISNREWLYEQLQQISYVDHVYPSQGNYILIKVSRSDIAMKLETEKILVRGYGEQGDLAGCIRITVGSQQENERLITAMKRYCD